MSFFKSSSLHGDILMTSVLQATKMLIKSEKRKNAALKIQAKKYFSKGHQNKKQAGSAKIITYRECEQAQ